MATIVLNGWSEIEVTETRKEIKELIQDNYDIRGSDWRFIEVTIEMEDFIKGANSCLLVEEKKVKADVYYKHILYIYD